MPLTGIFSAHAKRVAKKVSQTKAAAYAAGKDYVTPQDIQNVFLPTLGHRIILSSESVSRHLNSEQVLRHIMSKVRAPRI